MVAYLAHESRIGSGGKVPWEHLLFKLIHGVDHKIMAASFRPINYLLEPLLFNGLVKIRNEGGDLSLPLLRTLVLASSPTLAWTLKFRIALA
jgi:hypothetical protein